MINIRANRIKSKVNGFYKTIESYPFGEESIKFLKNYKGQKQENLKEEFIKFKQNEFIQEFEKYFKSNEYKEELANLKKYLISLKEEKPDLTNKFHKLTEAIKINNLDITLFEKCYQIEKIIPTSEEIWFLLAPFFVTCTRNSFIKKCFEIYEMLDKYEKGYIVPDMEGEILKEEIFKIYNSQANPLMLEKLKTDFLNKYKKYFQSQSYKNKVDRIDLFFRKSKALPENSSLYKLEK